MSESGALEFFTFASSAADHPRRIQNCLALITGLPQLPPLHTLGFHFSKYAEVSADIIATRSKEFTVNKFPVDVLWMDLSWAQHNSESENYHFFTFNEKRFPEQKLKAMNAEIETQNRFLTVIVDPFIKRDNHHTVYKEAQERAKQSTSEDLVNIFVKKPDGKHDFEGQCWSGTSSWVDFLNGGAQAFWQDLHSLDVMKGATDRFHMWNDMNEPSVFDTRSKTLPKDTLHYMSDGRCFEHRDIHNAYGALMQRSTFRGLLQRDDYKLRPFVLTRSWFLGSQKFGAHWTGDNSATRQGLTGSLAMLL